MLTITIPAINDGWDPVRNCFYALDETTLHLEHSLASLAKWEAKWCVPFSTTEHMTAEQALDYIRCMVLDENFDETVLSRIPQTEMDKINEYIKAPMTATWFNDKNNKRGRKRVITAELIYCWMFAMNIPLECEKWHLNRLFTLLRVCSEENSPKKESKGETKDRYRQLNAKRRAAAAKMRH